MRKFEINFDKNLYNENAIHDAIKTFKSFAGIKLMKDEKNFKLVLDSKKSKKAGFTILIGEIVNFILARTIELRAE